MLYLSTLNKIIIFLLQAKCGFILNIVAVLVLIGSVETLGKAVFGFESLSQDLVQNVTIHNMTYV